MWITGRKIAAICKSLKLMRTIKTFLAVSDLTQQIISPIPVPHNTWDKSQTTPAENCCLGVSPASLLLHELRHNCMTTYILYWEIRQEITVNSLMTWLRMKTITGLSTLVQQIYLRHPFQTEQACYLFNRDVMWKLLKLPNVKEKNN